MDDQVTLILTREEADIIVGVLSRAEDIGVHWRTREMMSRLFAIVYRIKGLIE
jgi:hypothetical protein